MQNTFNSFTNRIAITTTAPFIAVSEKPSITSTQDTQVGVKNQGQNDFSMLRYLLRQNCVTLHSLEAQYLSNEEGQEGNQPKEPFIYTSTLSRQRTLRMIMYRPQALLANTSINFVGFVSQKQNRISPEFEQELMRLDTILVEELTHMSGLLSYASLRTNAGTWYNLVLMSNDQVRSHLKQGAYHQYAAYQLAPHYYDWIRIHSGILPSGVSENCFEVHRTKYYTANAHAMGQTFNVHENTYATDERLTR